MRRTLQLVLAAAVLLVQWHLVMHVYQGHHHDKGRVCELCIAADLHQSATPSIPPALPAAPFIAESFPSPAVRDTGGWYAVAYRVRGPPVG